MPRYLTLSLQDSLHLSIIVGLLHLTLKREPKRIHEDFFVFTRISSNSNSASHRLRIRWSDETDGATKRISSAYKNAILCVMPNGFNFSFIVSVIFIF